MSTQSQNIAAIAAALSGDASTEKTVAREIRCNTVVSHLLAMRVAKGLTQEQVAEHMGYNPSKVSRLESGNDLNLKWADLVHYVDALGFDVSLTFEDPSLPAAERIKQCVFRIREDLDRLTSLAKQAGGNDEIARKVHEFSGEVLFNFLLQYRGHAEMLQSVIRVPAKREQPVAEDDGEEEADAAVEAAAE